MIIHWKGKLGYGDTVSPICYCINQSQITGRLVNLQFYWSKLKDPLVKANYYNTIELIKLIDNEGLIVDHNMSDLSKSHINFPIKPKDPDHIYHNVFFPKLPDNKKTLIAIGSPLFNKKPLELHGVDKTWKSGLESDQWQSVLNRYGHIHINYDTPFDELVDILSQTKYFIGYHGSVAWMARLFGCPMTIFSYRRKVTDWCFPWSLSGLDDIDQAIEQSTILLEKCKVERNEYIERLRRVRSERANSI